ncbi:uncharacterized protein A1O9_01648 [Exophiala aquamarina CBS 119918]|uniref:Uncharacterized protein n=1 Tax=Exophiala aquamarina CBS 119918 TaxID=1182545 RepID=A0A072Q6V6_9EURO|nr:uncharacterized protein A1O9_01648 [Exophiala aquamarina CBS 119918]KEF63670.1 hypothetical protein A1O9_01648 [Exophiala aquamarina CBS 119918]
MADESLDYTIPFQPTKTIRRDPYDSISPTNPELSAAEKVIIITGGGTDLGAAAAEVWARASAEGVVVAGRRLNKLQETVADLAKDTDVGKLFTETIRTFGRSPDVVMANAAVVADEANVGDFSPNNWWDSMVGSGSISDVNAVIFGE